jgi:hypothetical protein
MKEETDGGYHLPNAKSLIFFKTPNVHSFVDGGSKTKCITLFYLLTLVTYSQVKKCTKPIYHYANFHKVVITR